MTPNLRAADYQRQAILAWSETEFQNRILQLAGRLDWMSYHAFDSRRSQPGFPDLVLWHPVKRRLMFRELKKTKGVVSAAQDKCIRTLQASGADAAIWRPEHWFDKTIENELRGVDA